MKIIIRNIPENTTSEELVAFFTPFFKKSFKNPFRAKGKIVKQSIVAQVVKDGSVVRYHGLVTIEPYEVAKSILIRMRRTPFNGKKIIIREFVGRTWHNDRRNQPPKTSNTLHKRVDRRQHTLEVSPASGSQISFSNQSIFTRKHG